MLVRYNSGVGNYVMSQYRGRSDDRESRHQRLGTGWKLIRLYFGVCWGSVAVVGSVISSLDGSVDRLSSTS